MVRRALAGLAILGLTLAAPPAIAQPAQGPYRAELDRDPGFRAFLDALQRAVRADDRAAVLRLVRYPLRVNDMRRNQSGLLRRYYRSAAALRLRYDQVFTPAVRRAILAQSYETLWGNWQGYMIGDGALWFDRACVDRTCSRQGPVEIFVVNLSRSAVRR